MAADAPTKDATVNPCCYLWKDKCLKLEEGRKWLRQAVKVLNEQVDKIQAENIDLKKAYDEERTNAEIVKEARDRELAAKVSLESEICALKSEIFNLTQKGSANAEHSRGELKLLQDRLSEGEKEIKQLKELLELEKKRADTEKENAEAEKNNAAEAWRHVQAEKAKADKETNHVVGEGKKAEKYQLQLEASNRVADEVRSRLTIETAKFEETSRKIGTPSEDPEKGQPLAEVERKERDMTCAVMFPLENEISNLKSEICLLQENQNINVKDSDGVVRHLQNSISKGEKEIIQLKKLLNKEKDRADCEKKNAVEAWKRVESEGKKAEEYYRQVDILKKEVEEVKSKLECECLKHEEANRKLEAERSKLMLEHACAETEKREKEREYALRVSLESEMSALKVQISMLHEKVGTIDTECGKEEINRLQNHVSEGEKEIKQLNQLLEREKTRADCEKKKAEAEKKRSAQAWECVKVEKAKTEEEIKRTNLERKKAHDYYRQLERLKIEAEEAKSKLVAETLKFEEANRSLEAETQKVIKERKRADLEMAKAEKQRKIAEANGQKILEEKSHVENLSLQLADAKKRIEELQRQVRECTFSSNLDGVRPADQGIGIPDKIMRLQIEALKKEAEESRLKSISATLNFEEANRELEEEMLNVKSRPDLEMIKAKEQRKLAMANMIMAMEEKSYADLLSHKLDENKRKIEELQKQMLEHLPLRKAVDASPILQYKDKDIEAAQVSLLEKQLKLEKKHLKHAKQVAKFEKSRSTILQRELSRLRLELSQLTNRLEILDRCFSPSSRGTKGIEKVGASAKVQRPQLKRKRCSLERLHTQHENYCEVLGNFYMGASDIPKSLISLLPVSGVTCTETISGINSKLESLPGGSDPTLLQSSAINSSSASFSDGQLTGSQERLPESDKRAEEYNNMQTRVSDMSDEGAIVWHNGSHGMVAKNTSRRVHDTDAGRINSHGRKKSMLDAIESVEFLYSEGKKLQKEKNLSVSHHMLGRQINGFEEPKHVEFEMQCDSCDMHERSSKKNKVNKENNIMHNLSDMGELQKMETTALEDAITCRLANANATGLVEPPKLCMEDLSDSLGHDLESLSSFEEATGGDYMKLLELDDTSDEERYRRAIESPLSPDLPKIGLSNDEVIDVEKCTKPLMDESSQGGLSNEKEMVVHYNGISVIDRETSSNVLRDGTSGSLYKERTHPAEALHGSVDTWCQRNSGCKDLESENCFPGHNENSGIEPKVSELLNDIGNSVSNSLPAFCVAFPNANDGSISRILLAASMCMTRFSSNSQKDCKLQGILHFLRMEDNILSKEKACALFTLLLLNFSVCNFGKSGSFMDRDFLCSDSFARQLNEAVSDIEKRSLFDGICTLDELLILIEDFLMGGTILVYDDVTTKGCRSGLHITINLHGEKLNLSSKIASPDQLVAGSIILSSLCVAFGHIGFLCEVSYSILHMQRFERSVLLRILHVFAYLAGEKLFSSEEYYLTMKVLKFIVVVLEGKDLSVDSASCGFGPCVKCPFLEDSISSDVVMSMLVARLKLATLSGSRHQQHSEEFSNLSKYCVPCHGDEINSKELPDSAANMSCEASCGLKKCDRLGASWPSSLFHGPLCNLSNLLSLIELLVCYMSWEWTCSKVIPELLELLERSKLGNFTVAILIVLCQIGKVGVAACGYEDKAIQNLRCKLSRFLWQEPTLKSALLVQIATIGALLGLMSVDVEKIIQNNYKDLETGNQSAFVLQIRKWFSLLSEEQKELSICFLKRVPN